MTILHIFLRIDLLLEERTPEKTRTEILADFRQQIAAGNILLGVGVRTDIFAKCVPLL